MLFLEVISKYNVRLDALDIFELVLWLIVCCVLVVGIIFFYMEYKKSEASLFLFTSLEFLCFLVARISRSYLKYVVGQPVGRDLYPLDILILQIVTGCFTSLAIFLIYYDLEKKQLKKSHYAFSVLSIIQGLLIISEAITRSMIFAVLLIIVFVIIAAGLPLTYLYMSIKSSGIVRKKSFIIAVGMAFIGTGYGMDQPTGSLVFGGVFGIITTIIVPVFHIVGFLLMLHGYRKKDV